MDLVFEVCVIFYEVFLISWYLDGRFGSILLLAVNLAMGLDHGFLSFLAIEMPTLLIKCFFFWFQEQSLRFDRSLCSCFDRFEACIIFLFDTMSLFQKQISVNILIVYSKTILNNYLNAWFIILMWSSQKTILTILFISIDLQRLWRVYESI